MAASNTLGDMSPHKKTDENPFGAGRSARAGEPTSNITLRVTESELERYQAAAKRAGLTRTEWIRAACEALLASTAPPKKGRTK